MSPAEKIFATYKMIKKENMECYIVIVVILLSLFFALYAYSQSDKNIFLAMLASACIIVNGYSLIANISFIIKWNKIMKELKLYKDEIEGKVKA